MEKRADLVINNVDPDLLDKQKETLVKVIIAMPESEEKSHMDGILHLLDSITDKIKSEDCIFHNTEPRTNV